MCDNYPDGIDLSYFDDAPLRNRETTKGVPNLSYDFYCPHCEQVLCMDADDFDNATYLEEDCYHCGQPVTLEISADFIKGMLP